MLALSAEESKERSSQRAMDSTETTMQQLHGQGPGTGCKASDGDMCPPRVSSPESAGSEGSLVHPMHCSVRGHKTE